MTQTAPASSTQGRSNLPLIAMAVIVVVWGMGPPITKLITAPPLVGVLYRFAISSPIMVLILMATGGRLSWPLMRKTMLPGLSFGVNLIFVFAALQEATVSVLSVTVANQPALLLFLAGPVFGERPTLKHAFWTLGGVAGAAIVILGAGDQVRASWLGIGYAVMAMLTFTVYFVLTRVARSNNDVGPIEWMAGVNIWSFLAAVSPALLLMDRSDFAQFGGTDWLWILIVSLFTGAFGHVLMSWVHGYIDAVRSSLYMLAMHIVAVSLAWPIHDETVTFVQALGGVVVLVCVSAVIRLPAKPVAT
ncbi:MAG: drug/metabolite transporter (DMT)-like permease [Candidatus Poriferisodalaceae bacterium]